MKKILKPLIFGISITLVLFILASCTTTSKGAVEISLTYDSNGGSYVGRVTYRSDSVVKLPQNPTKPDETFEGWYWDKDIWKNPLNLTSVFSMPIHSELTVYAKWSGDTVMLKALAIEEIETEFLKYSVGYTKNYAAILAAKNAGILAVNAANSKDSIAFAKQTCIAEMASFPKDRLTEDAIIIMRNGLPPEYLEELGLAENPLEGEDVKDVYYLVRITSSFMNYLLMNHENVLRQYDLDECRFEATINGKSYAPEDLINIQDFFVEGYYDVYCNLYDKDENLIVSHTLTFFAGYPTIHKENNQVIMFVNHSGKASIELFALCTLGEDFEIPQYINGNIVVSAYCVLSLDNLLYGTNIKMYIPDSISNLTGLPILNIGVDTIVLPKTMANITNLQFSYMFALLEGIQNIIVNPENSYYDSYDGVLYSKDLTRLILVSRNRKQLTLSLSATYIDARSCDGIEKLIITQTSYVVDVHPDAFSRKPKVYVHKSMLEEYRSHPVWSKFEILVL